MSLKERIREILIDAEKVPLALPPCWGNIIPEIEDLESRLQSGRDELVRLCPGEIAKCKGRCEHQDSDPCEYHSLWIMLGYGNDGESSIFCPQHGLYFVDGKCPECENEGEK